MKKTGRGRIQGLREPNCVFTALVLEFASVWEHSDTGVKTIVIRRERSEYHGGGDAYASDGPTVVLDRYDAQEIERHTRREAPLSDDASEQCAEACGGRHGQSSPKSHATRAENNASPTGPSGQATHKRQKHERTPRHHGNDDRKRA